MALWDTQGLRWATRAHGRLLPRRWSFSTENPKPQPRLPAACLAPECPDPPGERIPGVSYFGCSPASRAKLLATLSPREDVWPGRSARAPGLPLHRECGGVREGSATRCRFCLSAYCTRLSRALVGSVDPVCPGLTAPGALPLAQRLRLPPGPTTVVAPVGRDRP